MASKVKKEMQGFALPFRFVGSTLIGLIISTFLLISACSEDQKNEEFMTDESEDYVKKIPEDAMATQRIYNELGTQFSLDNDSIEFWSKSLTELINLGEIDKVIKQYGLSLDSRNWDLHKSIYTERYKLYRNGQFREEHINDRVRRLDNFLNNYIWTQHIGSVYTVELNGGDAFVISSMNAYHEGKTRDNGTRVRSYLQTGLYHYWLTKTSGGWKIYQQRNIRSSAIRSTGSTLKNNYPN